MGVCIIEMDWSSVVLSVDVVTSMVDGSMSVIVLSVDCVEFDPKSMFERFVIFELLEVLLMSFRLVVPFPNSLSTDRKET